MDEQEVESPLIDDRSDSVQDCNQKFVRTWFSSEKLEPGSQLMSHEEILN